MMISLIIQLLVQVSRGTFVSVNPGVVKVGVLLYWCFRGLNVLIG